jgi:bifunctional UDP-N-acetylglucosamine pyrophosphorylase/glucosamine-1-phosphate N-acetyltransferase
MSMSMHGPVAIILAAGQGKRMRSERPKVLHEVCGQPMIRYVVDVARAAGVRSIVVIVGYGGDEVRAALAGEPDIHFAEQTEQRGTGHAVKCARPLLEGYSGQAMVLVGDEPLMRAEPLADLLKRAEEHKAACLLGTATVDDPTGFGRILRDTAGHFLRIIEQRDCDPDEAKIREVNPSCYVFDLPLMWSALDQLDTSNAQGEEYLTDAPTILQKMGHKVMALNLLHADDILGVNTRAHLAEAAAIMQRRIMSELMLNGVSIVDPRNTYIDGRAEIGVETTILPFTVIQGRVKVGKGCRIGPFAHLRDGTVLADGVDVGAFVELSASTLGENSRARHLAYLGNTIVGSDVNIGAGTITANFDGREKQRTEIGTGAMVGSGAILVAPLRVGEGALVAAGAVVPSRTEVPPGGRVAGVPARPMREGED